MDPLYNLDAFPILQTLDFSCDLGSHAPPNFHETYYAKSQEIDMPVMDPHTAVDQVESARIILAAVNQ